MNLRTTPIRLLLALTASFSMVAHAARGEPTTFTTEMTTHFAQWDLDHNGELSAKELDALVVDASITGRPAAALGVLKGAVRGGKYDFPPLTLKYFDEVAANKGKAVLAPAKVPDPAPTGEHVDAVKPPNLEDLFQRAARKIATTKRDLFTDGVPSLEACHQGRLGDCFFVSVVGAAVARDPESVHTMIAQKPDGSYKVTFLSGRVIQVPQLTDAELALTSTTGGDGLWLPVLEKAAGQVRNDTLPEEKQHLSATDAIARGGSSATITRLITGHQTRSITLYGRSSTETKTPGKPAAPTATPAKKSAALEETREQRLTKLRAWLKEAVRDHRLITAGTPTDGTPPGISPKHAYAVLGYDDAKDEIRLWNPHGNTFKPKGEAGIANGYPTKAGIFTMPVEQFASAFHGIAFETAEPEAKKN